MTGIGETWMALFEQLTADGYRVTGPTREVYVEAEGHEPGPDWVTGSPGPSSSAWPEPSTSPPARPGEHRPRRASDVLLRKSGPPRAARTHRLRRHPGPLGAAATLTGGRPAAPA